MNKIVSSIESFLLKRINVDRFLPIQIDITNACNLRCVHCYHPHHKNVGALSLVEWKEILSQYKALVQKMKFRPSVVLCGGEPLVSPLLWPLLNYVKSEMPTAEVSILSNGTLVTDATATKLQNYSQVRFQISLDGPDSNRHDLIRGAGNFEKALRGIRALRAHGLKVNVLSVLSAKTAPWMEDFFQLAAAEGFGSMNFIRFVPEGYGRKLLEASEDQPLIRFELKAAMENIVRLMVKYGVRSHVQAPLFELVSPGLGRSGRFWESIVVDYQGFIIASSRSKLRLGHAIHDGIEKVFTENEVFKSLRRGKVDGCGTCPLYSICGGDRNAAYAATGDFLGRDPGCWILGEQQINERKAL